jgi:5S rRNA maturation endonuclease (ribonuclease M5)
MRVTEEGLHAIMYDLGVEIYSDTSTDLICYCPLHANSDTPAFNMGKEPPYPWRCWNPKCGESGTMVKLIMRLKDVNAVKAMKTMNKYRSSDVSNIIKLLESIKDEEDTYDIWPESLLENVRIDYDSDEVHLLDTLVERGFELDTLRDFEVGFSKVQHRIVLPVRDEHGGLVGFSGRAIKDDQLPRYWDKGLPKRHILYNLNKAQQFDEVIIVEGPLDVIKVHQAGYKNVVGFFGGGFTKIQSKKLTRGFESVTIFTDNDEAGKDFADKIYKACSHSHRTAYIAKYPEGKKDPGELSKSEVTQAIENKVLYLHYKLQALGGKQL